ncbi:Asp-tRNA(Asn)/Glu-tRNA(Gln) amidotransferase subunit GatB [Candidatus Nomurabacteria bacterium]|nr:Asp-tRNA(Asn)/Glu-tRNA(Gln) amidotransferase subunit GatB [Candidatus Nomurabacteria bacterium]
MSELIPTIGLEIHAELKTQTKMFCRSRNDPDENRPNVNVCPVCLAHPGVLPTINKKAVEHVLRTGVALGGTLADYTEFDRKNYFYPDIPKGYQISQYQFPLISGGALQGVQLTRIHLEEDTASNQHSDSADESLVDFNRAGVPLMELVTEPVITSAKQAVDFSRELQLLLRYLNVSEANMEKGEMRVEANISIARAGERGTKVEVKNLNSFRAVERAIDYELLRQRKIVESGERVAQETRGWDEVKQNTFSQRKKESSHDYRYFPDPDLPKLRISEIPGFSKDNLQKTIPELPWQRREKLLGLGIQRQDAEQYVADLGLGNYFEKVVNELGEASLLKIASNFISNDIVGLLKREKNLKLPTVSSFVKIVRLFSEKKFNSRQAKDAIESLVKEGKEAEEVRGTDLSEVVAKVIADNPNVVTDYKSGKESALQFLIGRGMKESKGSANPEALKESLINSLSTGSAL